METVNLTNAVALAVASSHIHCAQFKRGPKIFKKGTKRGPHFKQKGDLKGTKRGPKRGPKTQVDQKFKKLKKKS